MIHYCNEQNGDLHILILDNLKESITNNLNEFQNMTREDVFNHRKNKFLTIGRNRGFISHLDEVGTLSIKKNKINIFVEKLIRNLLK